MSSFKDLFSGQASDYSKFRPRYPRELFQWLAEQAPDRLAAWDCGTGNGQAAVELGEFFGRVYATDPSEQQLKQAQAHLHVQYTIGTAEKSNLADQSVSLVTVAQAYHWFRHPLFFQEIQRVAKPGSVVAVWTYSLTEISKEIDATVQDYHDRIVGPYWEPEREHVSNEYRNLPFPYSKIPTPNFAMHAEWSFEHLVGYLGTWSAARDYLKKNNRNSIEEILPELRKAWGTESMRPVKWKLTVLAGRV